ncbi:F-box domain-containing protein [Mycena sanguinolenta]|uniref:F-box domain-containing protein n=1 Tax=Mycena sanguinolenta TaxID=230812 RepID=A0A8H7CS37_9AGAR|nr:F-box domain-containing protein [Mycena sanguinolenta]
MSVQELRARITKLDTEIDLQKEVLRKLERDKSLVQRQLNAVFDPIARLSLEICSEIFRQCLRGPIAQPGADAAPVQLLTVCNTWTDIALSTPDLWVGIEIQIPCTEGMKQLLPIWFQRARNRPVSVLLHGDFSDWDDSESAAVIWQHGVQLKRLKTSYNYLVDDDWNYYARHIHLFGGAAPEPLSSLEHLEIDCSLEDGGYLADDILELLRLAPNIVECVLGCLSIGHMSDAKPVVHTSLRRLTFGTPSERPDSNDCILNKLSLPALEALSLPRHFISDDDLLRFLKRSAPPLQEMTMKWGPGTIDPTHLRECVHLIPSLARFEIWGPHAEALADLFATLADCPSLLPNLDRLTIHNMPYGSRVLSNSAWKFLLRAVSARRIQLHLLGSFLQPPPTDILAALRELVGDGVEILISGPKDRDLISESPS